jgi:hypothetical protein
VGAYTAGGVLPEIADRVGQLRVGRNERLSFMRPTSRSLLSTLLLLAAGSSTTALAAQLGVARADAEILVEGLKALGLVSDAGVVTQRGRDEIAANKRGLRRTTANLAGSNATYYPLSLR